MNNFLTINVAQYMRLRSGQFSGGEVPPLDVINTRLNSKNQLISGNCSNMHCLLNLRDVDIRYG